MFGFVVFEKVSESSELASRFGLIVALPPNVNLLRFLALSLSLSVSLSVIVFSGGPVSACLSLCLFFSCASSLSLFLSLSPSCLVLSIEFCWIVHSSTLASCELLTFL